MYDEVKAEYEKPKALIEESNQEGLGESSQEVGIPRGAGVWSGYWAMPNRTARIAPHEDGNSAIAAATKGKEKW